MRTKLAALAALKKHFPDTADGKAHLHTEILELVERQGIEAVLSEAAILLLARKAIAVHTLDAARRGELRPTFGLIQGGKHG